MNPMRRLRTRSAFESRGVLLDVIRLFAAGYIAALACNGQTLYSDFGPNDTTSTNPWCVSGPNNPGCGPLASRWIAAPFTPSVTANLGSIALLLTNLTGTNGAEINLRYDSSGTPSSIIESFAVYSL